MNKVVILMLICTLSWGLPVGSGSMPIRVDKVPEYSPIYGGAYAINQTTPDYSIIASIPRDELWKVYVLIVFAVVVSVYLNGSQDDLY